MTHNEVLAALTECLRDLTSWLESRGLPHVIVGGVAAALQGSARATADVDAVVLAGDTDLKELLADAARHGFVPRRPDAAEFAVRSRVLLLEHQGDGIGLDLALGALAFEQEMVAQAVRRRVQEVEVPLARPEDLIVMKTLAFRAVDVTDIVALLDAHPRLDLEHVRQCVQAMAEALEAPEIAERLEKLLSDRKPSRRRKRTPRNPP